RRRHTRCLSDWSSDVCSSDLPTPPVVLISVHRIRITDKRCKRIWRSKKTLRQFDLPIRALVLPLHHNVFRTDDPHVLAGGGPIDYPLSLRCSTAWRIDSLPVDPRMNRNRILGVAHLGGMLK